MFKDISHYSISKSWKFTSILPPLTNPFPSFQPPTSTVFQMFPHIFHPTIIYPCLPLIFHIFTICVPTSSPFSPRCFTSLSTFSSPQVPAVPRWKRHPRIRLDLPMLGQCLLGPLPRGGDDHPRLLQLLLELPQLLFQVLKNS